MFTIIGHAWKIGFNNKTNCNIYRLELEGIDNKNNNKIDEIMKDWKKTGFGFNLRNNSNNSFLYSREFQNVEEWQKWCKEFPYTLYEMGIRTNKKRLVNIAENDKDNKKRQYVCKRCGQIGHNTRTCSKKQ